MHLTLNHREILLPYGLTVIRIAIFRCNIASLLEGLPVGPCDMSVCYAFLASGPQAVASSSGYPVLFQSSSVLNMFPIYNSSFIEHTDSVFPFFLSQKLIDKWNETGKATSCPLVQICSAPYQIIWRLFIRRPLQEDFIFSLRIFKPMAKILLLIRSRPSCVTSTEICSWKRREVWIYVLHLWLNFNVSYFILKVHIYMCLTWQPQSARQENFRFKHFRFPWYTSSSKLRAVASQPPIYLFGGALHMQISYYLVSYRS